MADNVDIFVILAGYIMMIITFVSLFVNMRRMGSRYSLGRCISYHSKGSLFSNPIRSYSICCYGEWFLFIHVGPLDGARYRCTTFSSSFGVSLICV